MEPLKRRKAGLKSSLTYLMKDLDDFLAEASEEEIRAKLTRIESQRDKYEALQEEITPLFESDETYLQENEEDEKYLQDIYVVVATLKGKVEVKKTGKTGSKFKGVKLPQLQLPTFSGDPRYWSNFWDMFSSVVHDNEELTRIQKFTYLRGQLQGDAYKLVEGFAVESASYLPAIEALQTTFGHPDRVKAAYVVQFNELSPPKMQVDDIKRFYAEVESVMRSLNTQEVTLEEFCVVSLLNKLPSPLQEIMRREMGDKPLDYYQFNQCLQAEVYNMTSIGKERYRETPIATASFAVQSENQKSTCRLCQGVNHPWYRCFQYKTSAQKTKRARQLHLCQGCLSKDHGSEGCTNPFVKKCKHCKGKHFHALCTKQIVKREPNKSNVNSNSESKHETTATMCVGETRQSVILPTIQLPVKGVERATVKIRAVLDQCSQKTFVRRSILSTLKYKSQGTEKLTLHGFTGTKEPKEYLIVALKYKHRGKYRRITAVVVDELPEHKAASSLEVELNSLKRRGYKLADPSLTQNAQLDLLLGADQYYDIVHPGYERVGSLVLIPTRFGYALSGTYAANPTVAKTEIITVLKLAVTPIEQVLSEDNPCHDNLEKLWELDHIGISPKEYSKVEKQALNTFANTVSYDTENQQYEVRLPWNENKHYLPTNKGLVVGRLRGLQKRFIAEPEFFAKYNKVLKEQLSRGFIEEIPHDQKTDCHYLAHHGVMRESITTPVRIVFDCSAKISKTKPSLNNCLLTGPSLVPDLAKILLRFRLHKFAWVADIEKAFLMLKLHEEDRDYTRFLWPEDPMNLESPLNCYRFKVVLFGATCSQFLLNATIVKHFSSINLDEDIVNQVRSGLYVDNLLGTGDDETSILNTYCTVCHVMEEAHLYLKEWATNSPRLRERVKMDEVAASQQELVKVLGLVWHTSNDMLSFGVNFSPSTKVTKRECLSISAKIFDPLGVLLPVIIRSRIFLQQLWRLKVEWDEEILGETREEWDKIKTDLIICGGFNFPRRIVGENPITLHAFADASNKAYGTAVYIVSSMGSYLAMSKAKVAPIKSLTVPKMELTAVLLAARLIKFVEEAFQTKLTISDTFIWSDSKITLHWIHSKKQLPVYVTNRVDEIHSLVPTAKYRYVSTKDNPSDMVTRGLSAEQLRSSALWWNGPQWLTHQDEWPENIELSEQGTDVAVQITDATNKDTRLWDWDRYGSFMKLTRVAAWVLRFVHNLKAKISNSQPTCETFLSVKEIKTASHSIIKLCQKESYPMEYGILKDGKRSKNNLIKQLGLHLKGDVIHCGGRLKFAALTESQKYPILLPPKHPLTHLLIEWCHKLCCHYGVGHVVTYVRQNWWVPRIRQVVKRVLKNCLTCRRTQGKPYTYPGLPPLPAIRTNPGDPYKVTGVDYSGAMTIKDSPNAKAYMILFTCAVTRSIHIEVVTNLTCDSFLHAFRRFCSREGFPRIMMSDNATTFVGAARHLELISKDPSVRDHLNEVQCEWRFIPARAPWFGAIWERAIGIVKSGLKKVLGRALVTLEELTTILLEMEAVVNDRPLTYASGDLDDINPITPSLLVRGYRLRNPPETDGNFEELTDPNYISSEVISMRYKYIRKLSADLWKRWSTEYLVTLREARKLRSKDEQGRWPQVGDVVLIHDEGPRLFWKLGRITDLLPGRDEGIRVAKVRTKLGITSRPTTKLYPLEQSVESMANLSDSDPPVEVVSDLNGDEHTATGNVVQPSAEESPQRPRRIAAQASSQSWRDKIASGLL